MQTRNRQMTLFYPKLAKEFTVMQRICLKAEPI